MKDIGVPLLKVENVSKFFVTGRGVLRAVNSVSIHLDRGETLGVVGESGSGKTTLGKILVRLIEPNQGTMTLGDTNYTHLAGRSLQKFRRRLQMVFQDPQSSLNPRSSIGRILEEPFIVQGLGSSSERKTWARAALARVGLDESFASRRPHELSGGQRQRVAIARAIALEPDVIVCDEPVSALDVSVQGQIINLLKDIQHRASVSYVFITHNLSILTYIAHRVAVMYMGRVVELGPTAAVWTQPLHPYTAGLISAIPEPRPHETSRAAIVPSGEPPDVINPPAGCVFHPRCPKRRDTCAASVPELREVKPGRFVACHVA